MHWNWIAFLGILSYVIGVLALFIIPANRKPGEATAWLLLGSPKLSRWRRDQQRAMNERIKDLAEDAEHIPELRPIVDPPLPARYEPHVNLIAQLTGILSHVGFDLISHDTNLLLYPWVENARWLPGWWYQTWFKVRPLPMFGHSYAVGVFSVIWGLLTLLGIFLFAWFLKPDAAAFRRSQQESERL